MGRLIDKDALLAEYDHVHIGEPGNARKLIENAPTIEEHKTGKWVKLDMHAHLADHKCSACGQECYVPTCMGEPMYAYCPNCGAKMEREQ